MARRGMWREAPKATREQTLFCCMIADRDRDRDGDGDGGRERGRERRDGRRDAQASMEPGIRPRITRTGVLTETGYP